MSAIPLAVKRIKIIAQILSVVFFILTVITGYQYFSYRTHIINDARMILRKEVTSVVTDLGQQDLKKIDYKKLKNTLSSMRLGNAGYSFIVTRDGTFIYHPLEDLVLHKKSLIQFAQESQSSG